MAEWLVEEGIGEDRALLIEGGHPVEAVIEDPDAPLRCGQIAEARVGAPQGSTGRTWVTIDGVAALLRGRPPVPEGARIRVEIVREPIPEQDNPKPAQVVLTDQAPRTSPRLAERLGASGIRVNLLEPWRDDRIEAQGWSEICEAARTGLHPFTGGLLRLALTPAMTVIDVDGTLPPDILALAGAEAAARAIRLFGIAGSIGVDLPSATARATRQACAQAFDQLLPPPFERTAVNGFGFIQIVRPRARASLLEQVQADPVGGAARALLRRAERAQPPGVATLVAAPAVIACIAAHPHWRDMLASRRGGAIGLRADERQTIYSGYVES